MNSRLSPSTSPGDAARVRHDSYCGLNCGACPVGLANERQDMEALAEMARDRGREPEELVCGGCKAETTSSICSGCSMRSCAMTRGFDFCFLCPEYPCERLEAFRNDSLPHHSMVYSNLAGIRRMGVEAWLSSETARWSCPTCFRRFSWYEGKCSVCGSALYNSVEEEKDLVD